MTITLFLEAWKKMIHEKNLTQKSYDPVPLKQDQQQTPGHLYICRSFDESV
jgi:hypothetical protein